MIIVVLCQLECRSCGLYPIKVLIAQQNAAVQCNAVLHYYILYYRSYTKDVYIAVEVAGGEAIITCFINRLFG